jgi:hypothetical protein
MRNSELIQIFVGALQFLIRPPQRFITFLRLGVQPGILDNGCGASG